MKSPIRFTVEFVAFVDDVSGDPVDIIDEIERAVIEKAGELRQDGALSKLGQMKANFNFVKGGKK